MTLVLNVDWSADVTSATVFDIAARSIVGDGRSPHSTSDISSSQGSEPWWSALVDATSTALDSIAALGLTVTDIRLLVLTSTDSAMWLEHLDGRNGRVESASVVDTDIDWSAMVPALAGEPRSVGRLSTGTALDLGLPDGLPLFVGTVVTD